MSGLETAIKAQGNVLDDMLGTLTKQNDSIESIGKTVNKLYGQQIQDAAERKRIAQDAKRRSADKGNSSPTNARESATEKAEKKKGGSLIDKLLGFFGVGGVLAGILSKTIGGLFSAGGFIASKILGLLGMGAGSILRRAIGGIFGKNGLIRSSIRSIFSKDGFINKQIRKAFGKDGFIQRKFGEIFGKNGKLSKMITDLKAKFPKLGNFVDDIGKKAGKIGTKAKGLGKGLGKFAKSAKGGGALAAVLSGGLKFAETGDTGQAVTQGAGAGGGALLGGAIGSLIAPGIGTAIGATIGGMAGDFLTEELRKSGFLKPMEDTINGAVDVIRKFVDWSKPFFEGLIESYTNTFNEIKVTFDLLVQVGEKISKNFGAVFQDTIAAYQKAWDGFNNNVIKPLGDGLKSIYDFLQPVLKPLEQLALKIIDPLAKGLGMLLDKIKNLPFLKGLFGGDGEGRKAAGRGFGDVVNFVPNLLNQGVQGVAQAYLNTPDYESNSDRSDPVQKQIGGPISIPGSSFGDSYPMALPPGSFVLNRNAAQQFQQGGMVNTLLEPGEKVFMPGTYGPEVPMMNDMVPRFQTGGMVGKPPEDTSKEPTVTKGETKKSGEGGSSAVVSAGKMLLKEGFTVAEHPNFKKHEGFRPKGDARVGGHSTNSLHYKNLALDVTDWRDGDWQGRTRALAEQMFQQKEQLKLTQIIHDPWGSWFAGQGKGGAIGGHPEHLHLGFAAGPAGDTGKIGEGGFLSGLFGGGPKEGGGEETTTGGGGGGGFMSMFNGLEDSPIAKFFKGAMDIIGDSFLGKVLFGGLGAIGDTVKSAAGTAGDAIKGAFGGGGGGGGGQSGFTGEKAATGTKNEMALLNAIADAEGTSKQPNSGYNTHYAYDQTSDLSKHPAIIKGSGKLRSDAFGRYQFMSPTWAGLGGAVAAHDGKPEKSGLDMSPANQDRLAIQLAKQGGINVDDGLSMSEIPKIGKIWASVTGGGYGQDKYGPKAFMEMYKKYGGEVEGKQSGGMVGVQKGSVRTMSDAPEPVEKKQTGGVVGAGAMKGNISKVAQEFRQQNMKKMSQSAGDSAPIVIVNNGGGGGSAQAAGPAPAQVPSLPNEPRNSVWKSHYNFAQRISIG